MKTFHTYSILLLAVMALSAVSCKNSVTDHEEEHPEPYGYRLVMGNIIVAESIPGSEPTNEFPELTAGTESMDVEVYFYDFDKNIFQPDEPEQSLLVETGDDQIVQIKAGESKWSFSITALAAGSTSIIINLMHNDHPDFTSDSIAVQVKNAKN